MKYFEVDVMVTVRIPYDKGLLDDGSINKNHLMYISQAELDKNPEKLNTTKMMYKNHRLIETFEETKDKPGYHTITKL